MLDFNKPITTRGGSKVRIYDIREDRWINGAYYEETDDVWWPVQWSFNGNYGYKPSALDLVNDYKKSKIAA